MKGKVLPNRTFSLGNCIRTDYCFLFSLLRNSLLTSIFHNGGTFRPFHMRIGWHTTFTIGDLQPRLLTDDSEV